jgi:glycosyltransferase involved in cell wall biosynthesis
MTAADVTVIIPHIPTDERSDMLARALTSIKNQTVEPAEILLQYDDDREGAAALRNKMLPQVKTKWIAFLDDDDEWLPIHLATLLNYARNDAYDVLYPGCRVYNAQGLEIPRRMEWGRFLQPFDASLLRLTSYIPVTSLVRTELAQLSEFKPPPGSVYDDWGFYLKLLDLGARFKHVPHITWNWFHHGANSSGLPSRVRW